MKSSELEYRKGQSLAADMRFSFAASWVREIAKTPPALPL